MRQVCTFFFFKHEREKEIRAPLTSSPACPRGQTIPSQRPPLPALRRPNGDTRRALPGRSPARIVGAPLPPLRQPAAALPARHSDGDPAEAVRATPASLALSCFWNAGGEGRASWGISAPARSRPPPRPASLVEGPGSGERDTAVSQLRVHLARPTHRPRARKVAAASTAPRRARAAPCPEGPRGPPRVAGQPRH